MLPTPQACVAFFGIATLFTFLAFVVYAGILGNEKADTSNNPPPGAKLVGHNGPGFALCVFSASCYPFCSLCCTGSPCSLHRATVSLCAVCCSLRL